MLRGIRSTVDKWHNDFNEVSERVMQKEYSWLLKLSLFYPDLKKQNLLPIFLQMITFYSIIFSHIFFFVKTALNSFDDFVLMATSANYVMLTGFFLFLQMLTMFNRSDISHIHALIGTIENIYDEENNSEIKEIKAKNNKFKNVIKLAIPLVNMMCGLCVILVGPIIDGFAGKSDEKGYSGTGVNYQLPVPIWYPFESHAGFKRVCALLFQSCLILILLLILHSIGSLYVCITVKIASHLELLTLSIRNIEERSLILFQKFRNQRKKTLLTKDLWSDNGFIRCIELCLVENIKHHQAIVRLNHHMCKWSKFTLATTVFASALTIALSAFLVTSIKEQPGALVSFLIMCLGQLFYLLIVCYLGQNIIDRNKQFHWEIYNLSWFNYKKSTTNYFKTMQVYSAQDFQITGAFSSSANMETFGKILNTAYSYMSLLLAWDNQ